MNDKNIQTKKRLLEEIEKLISYGKKEPTINPDLLAYFNIDELQSIKVKLIEHAKKLSNEDKIWLKQFKKYD